MDEEEDYMCDKFLLTSPEVEKNKPVKFKREFELYKKRLRETETQKNGSRNSLVGEKIDRSNIGFKMLEKMGFKEGTGLGTSYNGIKEPVTAKMKTDRAGLGHEEEMFRGEVKRIRRAREDFEHNKRNFMMAKRDQSINNSTMKHLRNSRNICQYYDLMNNKKPKEAAFWPVDEAYQVLSLEEEFSVLVRLLQYLRSTYHYCAYCAVKYDDQEDLDKNCPGDMEEDH